MNGICEKMVDRLMAHGPCLPLTLTSDSKKRWIRIAGLLWYLFWAFPVLIILAVPLLVLLLASCFEETWKGTL